MKIFNNRKNLEDTIIFGEDFIVQMPPIKEYTIRAKVVSVEKATPHIIDLDELLVGIDLLEDATVIELPKEENYYSGVK